MIDTSAVTPPPRVPRPWLRLPRPRVKCDDLTGQRLVCPLCRLSFVAWQVGPWALRPLDDQTDLRRVYAGSDPVYYAVWVCPDCHYAALPADWYDLAPDVARRLRTLLQRSRAEQGIIDFTRERDASVAKCAYLLAQRCYEVRHQPPHCRLQARLALSIAWCARDQGHLAEERMWLANASRDFLAAYERDPSLTTREELALGYLLGELALRLDEPERALRYYHGALRHPAVTYYPAWERRLRDGCARASAQLPCPVQAPAPRRGLVGRLLRLSA